ncbi:MAG: ribosome recycling factor [Polyangia bacterium]|jgi:ribosome recycling factor
MVNDIVKDLEAGIGKAHEALKKELAKVRTGRANLSLIDGVRVDYYGTPTPLNQVASCSTPDARLIVIKPWEKKLCGAIEEAVRKAELGVNPSSDGELVRIPIPALTEERRKELTRVVKRMGEDGRVAIRNLRRDANDLLKEAMKGGDISEDDEKQGLKKVQDAIDRGVAKADEIVAKKEAEIMEV